FLLCIERVVGLAAPRQIHRILDRGLVARELRLLPGGLVVIASLLVALCDMFGLDLFLCGLVVLLGGLLFFLDRGAALGPRRCCGRFLLLLNLFGTRGKHIV